MSTPDTCWDAVSVLQELAETVPDRIAVLGPEESVTFAQLYRRAVDEARGLTRRYGAPGGIVVLPAQSTAAFLTSVAATWVAGYTPLPVAAQSLEQISAEVQALGAPLCRPWKAVVRVYQGRPDVLLTHGESPASPRKGEALGMSRGGSALIASPLHYNGPFEFAVRQLLLGGTVILSAPFTCSTWLSTVARHRPTWAFAVPTQVRRLIEHAGLPALAEAATSLTRLLISSQPLPAQLASALVEGFGPGRVAQYYGTAEYDGTLAFLESQLVHSSAKPISGAQLRVMGHDGIPAGPGDVGLIQGRSQAGLITHRLRETCPAPETWTTVGDHGRLTAAGDLELLSVAVAGRAIVGGVKVGLEQIRSVVEAHDEVARCLVQVEPDQDYGQVVTIRVIARRASLTVEALHRHCTAHLASAERPRTIHIDPQPREDVTQP